MAVKIIETKTGKVIKTSKQVKRDRTIRKVQKYISVAAAVMILLMMSAVTVFATSGGAAATGQPSGVDTSTMTGFGSIVWWIVRVVILAAGGIPGLINFVKGQSDQDDRQRNGGLIALIATAAGFIGTFALQNYIGF